MPSEGLLLLVDWLLLILIPPWLLPSLPVQKVRFYHIDDFSTLEPHHSLNCSHCLIHPHVLSDLYTIHSLTHFHLNHKEDLNILQSVHFSHIIPFPNWKLFDLSWSWTSSSQRVYTFDVPWLLHSLNVFFIFTGGFMIRIRWNWLGLEEMVKLLLFVNYHALVLVSCRWVYAFAGRWMTVTRLTDLGRKFIDFGLKWALLDLCLDFFKSLQILFVCHDSMKEIKLLISIVGFLMIEILGILGIKFVRDDFSIALNNEPDDFKEGEFLSLFFCEVFTVEFDEFEEDGFEEELSLLYSLIDVHQCHNSVKDESSGDDVVSEVD